VNVECVQINVTRWRCNKCDSLWERVKDAVACSEGHAAEVREMATLLRYGTLDPAVAIWGRWWQMGARERERKERRNVIREMSRIRCAQRRWREREMYA